ncbi:carboxylesterase/lipase family protein [Proteiniphilum sp. UBA1028]|jgi:para-nitrobenzyl esterase|uniref:carboxylesterase/lipase family protein n=1 Tax=Proteiniphilum sp. UBA1028 TaxID=1947251 RepID=UPI0025DB2FBA|nr:carboxylesterase/lipase family protein [Proteiniphilum sp. UBA1028]
MWIYLVSIIAFILSSFLLCVNNTSVRVVDETQCEIMTSENSTVVNTESGEVAGYIEKGVYIYKGIPYAQAERFMPPIAVNKWEGVRSSRSYGPTCPQAKRTGWLNDEQAFAFDWDDGYADEDCMRINIWTPGINDYKKRPVMVWLHGGGYSAGSGQELPSYDGTNLAGDGDVVVVTLNHRLNVLGFLDLSAYGEKFKESGNVGLLDIVAALQWVNRNISYFGGDASNVTIFGQSGGGGKVSTLLATPSAKGLFHKAIIQSGAMLRTMEAKWSRRIGTAVMRELGLNSSEIDVLQQLPYDKLLAAGDRAVTEVRREAEKEGHSAFIFGWAPTVDDNVLPSQPFSSRAPDQSKEIPVLLGSNLHEFCKSTYVPSLRNITREQAVERIRQKYGERVDEFLRAFEKAYSNYKPQDLIDIDFLFRPNTVELANIKSAQGGAPVYMYFFTWESPVLDGSLRSLHCMELPFVFDNVQKARHMTGGGAEAQLLAERMSGAWLSFAHTGNPNTEDLPDWERYTPEEGVTMFFDNTCEVKYNHDKELLDIVRLFPQNDF